jgi:hypothetical protein
MRSSIKDMNSRGSLYSSPSRHIEENNTKIPTPIDGDTLEKISNNGMNMSPWAAGEKQ